MKKLLETLLEKFQAKSQTLNDRLTNFHNKINEHLIDLEEQLKAISDSSNK